MMETKWTSKAAADLERLYEFLAVVDRGAALATVKSLVTAPEKLALAPRMGEQLFQFAPREVRRVLVGNYELRYEVKPGTVYVLRLWHTREKR